MTLKKLAEHLLIIKPLLNIIFFACVVFIVILFLNMSIAQQNSFAVPSLLLATWSLLLSAIIGLLVNTPSTDNNNKHGFARLKFRFAKGLFNFAVVVFIFISFALLYMTIKLLNISSIGPDLL